MGDIEDYDLPTLLQCFRENGIVIETHPNAQTHIRRPWVEEEDILLMRHAKQSTWREIAKMLRRTDDACRNRYFRITEQKRGIVQHRDDFKPSKVPRTKWSRDEDDELKKLVARHGSQWNKFATHLDGRKPQSIRNRWQRLLYDEKLTER